MENSSVKENTRGTNTNTKPCGDEKLMAFTRFPDLPTELRRKIWLHAFPAQIVIVDSQKLESRIRSQNYAYFFPVRSDQNFSAVIRSCREAYWVFKDDRQNTFKTSYFGPLSSVAAPIDQACIGPPRLFLAPRDIIYFRAPWTSMNITNGTSTELGFRNLNAQSMVFGKDVNLPVQCKIAFQLRFFISSDLFDCLRAWLYHNPTEEIMIIDYSADHPTHWPGSDDHSHPVDLALSGDYKLVELPQDQGTTGARRFLNIVGEINASADRGPNRRAFVENTFGHEGKMISMAEFRKLKIRRMAWTRI